MEQVTLGIHSQRANIWICDSVTEYFSKDFTDIFASKIFSYKSFWNDDSFINTANIYLLMTYIDNASWTDCCSKACHDAFKMKIEFFEADGMEEWMNKHFYVSSYENVGQDDNAIKIVPFFFRDFYFVFHQVCQDVL